MPFRLLTHLPPDLQVRYRHALETLNGLTVGEQIEVACQVVVGLLMTARLRFEEGAEQRRDFNLLCEAVEEWLAHRVCALRLTRE